MAPEVREPTVKELIAQYDWDTDVAYAVMMAESGGRDKVVNPEWHRGCQGSYSLFQVACIHYEKRGIYGEARFDAETNVQIAYEIWQEQGWSPWGAFTNLSYQNHLANN